MSAFALTLGVWAAQASLLEPSAAATASDAFVRVDEVGYATGAAKRAYLMARRSETGRTFVVRSASGEAVLEGLVGASLGSWSKHFPYVYALDFDAVRAPGAYTVSVSGRTGSSSSASSPPFAIAPAAALYEAPLANALSFYENERDGPDFIRSALRTAPGHLNDRHARTYVTPKVDDNGAFKGDLHPLPAYTDAAGGWWDAGDYLKFVQTTSYTVSLMLLGIRDFPAEMGVTAGRSDFVGEARFGVQWLLRMWDDRTRTLYYQVGIG
ncbi:MAG TPA: glycoside hydrolase family 9 protein, partial [Solirubrobacteraceae bacterium]|nr:glycoside hydrolase family 9 protein [Solirubrobacteraceae bacterium]